MDIRRRNTRKYSFICPDLKELRKLTSFVDDPKDFRDRFGKLLSILSINVENVSDRVHFYGLEGILKSQVIVGATHLKKFDVDANLTIKGGIRGLTLKFLIERASLFANVDSMVDFEAILALLVYGLVLFPNNDNFIDVNSIRIFLVGNHVPTLIGGTYFSIHHRTFKGNETIIYYAPLLYEGFISHLPQSPTFKENKGCLRWSQRLMSLNIDDITWYSFVYDNDNTIDSCGEFSNVPFIGTQGGMNYNSALARL
ncbi:uncharacterized protein LOC127094229 [Lathyrus oleraceus]|uniref:uncharacterized protein LOC127094229 n=1 Tax=Pisum sativum TaxID=3888 RepID=UPI0021D2D5A3|nr:uncharacterized protein LOC127094229 [Pisum sativum]